MSFAERFYKEIEEQSSNSIFWNTYYMNEDDTHKYKSEFIFKKVVAVLLFELLDYKLYESRLVNIRDRYLSKGISRENTIDLIEEVKPYTFYRNQIK